MSLSSFFRKLYYSIFSSDKACREKVRKIMNVKVRSPFDSNEIITLGDLFVSTAITEHEIIEIAESYGIKFPSQAVDISGNHALEYLLYHNEDLHYTFQDTTGRLVDAGLTEIGNSCAIEAIPLVPNSHFARMIEWQQTSNETFESFFGHSAEFAVRHQLSNMGIETYMPDAGNNPGYDILCNRQQFFEKFGVDLPPIAGDNSLGMLQIKATTGEYYKHALDHFDKYPDIPMICSNRIFDSIVDKVGADSIIPFSACGINDIELQNQVFDQYQAVNNFEFGTDYLDAGIDVKTGLASSHFSDSLNGSYETGFHLPLMAMAIRGALSTYKNYRLYSAGEISWKEGSLNVSRDVGKTAIISGTTIVATSAVTGMLGLNSSEAANNLWESVGGDFDWDNLGDLGELALIAAIATGIGYGVKKIWNLVVGDPLEKLKKLIADKQSYLIDAGNILIRDKNRILQYFTPENRDRVRKSLAITDNRLDNNYSQFHVKPFEYYVLEYKKELLESVKKEHDACEKSLRDYFSKIETLIRILCNCRSGYGDIEQMKWEFQVFYTNMPKNVTDILKKIKKHSIMADFITSVLSQEIKQIVSKLKEMRNPTFSEIEYNLDFYDNEISRETKIQRRKGNL